ncbi:hypothetical protein EDB89DRAFT_2191177 [Lactarius sanguifluus]|nr:hypothetical protein EDB89DRAFT_2191177 [Lactarius sanguifluus]
MVNWHDPVLVLRDYLVLIKLNHSLAGIYIWETVFTMGFELDVLRGKRPYKWTIWPYLGTRYFGLAAFIVFFVDTDGGKVPCQPLIVANYALPYISWAFASLIIVIRVQVLFQHRTATHDTECTPLQHCDMESPYYHVVNCDRNIVGWSRAQYTKYVSYSHSLHATVSRPRVLILKDLTMVDASYDPILQTCITLKTHRGLTNSIAVLVVDIKFDRYMCIIWIALAGIAEIPPVVFLILNLNDPWNEMFTGVAITILSIGAARMYRTLSKRGSLTEYSSEPPRNSSGLPFSTFQSRDPYNVRRTTTEAPVFVPADEIQVEFVPGASAASLAVPPKTQSKDAVAYQTVQLRPG